MGYLKKNHKWGIEYYQLVAAQTRAALAGFLCSFGMCFFIYLRMARCCQNIPKLNLDQLRSTQIFDVTRSKFRSRVTGRHHAYQLVHSNRRALMNIIVTLPTNVRDKESMFSSFVANFLIVERSNQLRVQYNFFIIQL